MLYNKIKMVSTTNSTLVETVSINYEDFNESFLTCGTCLCTYDGGEHTPKLLPCSHTVCLHCLLRIAAQNVQATTFRCPICRESITIPRGGVPALPPSFLVNQLLDLMASHRREVIPKCSVHIAQELLFCETCDTVFCSQCTSGGHSSLGLSSCEHTVIPFSIAIKRMSEILLYKANECISKLTEARDIVQGELDRLENSAAQCLERVDAAFCEAHASVDARKQAVVGAISAMKEAKQNVLAQQIQLIQAEKDKVAEECEGLQYQVEVRNISQRISLLGEKLDSVASLAEPRENSYLGCDLIQGAFMSQLATLLQTLGRVRTTTTFPSLSTLSISGNCVAGLECTAVLTTVDYHGVVRSSGGDPIDATVIHLDSSDHILTSVQDMDDGTYNIKFRPLLPGRYEVKVSVIDRCVKQSPLIVEATQHNDPVCTHGSKGSGKMNFSQPVAVAYDTQANLVYVVDSGNCRIKALTPNFKVVKVIEGEGLEGRSCTGIAFSPNPDPWMAIVNWRQHQVTRLSTEGETQCRFSFSGFQEPIALAIDSTCGNILIADNHHCCVFVFDHEGKFLFQIGKKGNDKGCFNLISSVSVGVNGEVVIADSRIQVFSPKGDFIQEIYPEGKGKGRYGGITVDQDGRIIGSRSEKGKNFIQIFELLSGRLLSTIDLRRSKVKRPSGVAVTNDHHVFVVDLGSDCIHKYRYW